VSTAQNWTLLGMVTVLLSVIGGLFVHQLRLVGDRIEARIGGLESTTDARLVGLKALMDARFDAVDQRFDAVDRRFDHLDGDVEAIARIVFPRD
jgi:hypothetical protein